MRSIAGTTPRSIDTGVRGDIPAKRQIMKPRGHGWTAEQTLRECMRQRTGERGAMGTSAAEAATSNHRQRPLSCSDGRQHDYKKSSVSFGSNQASASQRKTPINNHSPRRHWRESRGIQGIPLAPAVDGLLACAQDETDPIQPELKAEVASQSQFSSPHKRERTRIRMVIDTAQQSLQDQQASLES